MIKYIRQQGFFTGKPQYIVWKGVILMFDKQLLEKKLDESGYRLSFIADKLGISHQAFLKKRNGELPFKVTDIQILAKLCNWDAETIYDIFFTQYVAV